MTALLAVPLVVLPDSSPTLYLYNLYGGTITVYGANPIYYAPSSFTTDPHLPWIHWRELRSSYGPIWLMLSAGLSSHRAGPVDDRLA